MNRNTIEGLLLLVSMISIILFLIDALLYQAFVLHNEVALRAFMLLFILIFLIISLVAAIMGLEKLRD